jgi:hypothetical protein
MEIEPIMPAMIPTGTIRSQAPNSGGWPGTVAGINI